MNRNDFPMLEEELIYFDNGATTLKPKCVIDAVNDYYSAYTANVHRGDYDNSIRVDNIYEDVRNKVKDFIGATRREEIIFTKGTTDSLNMIVYGYMKYVLKKGDEVLLTKAEHASNVLPWLELQKEIGIVIKYIPLKELKVNLEDVKKMITKNTKVISIAHVSNVIGDVRPIKEIGDYLGDKDIYFVVDAAQSIPHMGVNVVDLNIDFLAFSGHKMLAPTGIGVLYGKYELLNKMTPMEYGGGMNESFSSKGITYYTTLPSRLEAGTPNISGVIGLGAAINYLNKIGMDNIQDYEYFLKRYLLSKLINIKEVVIYNDSYSGIVIFNVKDIDSHEIASKLNNDNIAIRAGNHCAKMLMEELNTNNTCRISLYFYNTKEEIDFFIKKIKTIVLEKSNP